jgi:hypothetical protein
MDESMADFEMTNLSSVPNPIAEDLRRQENHAQDPAFAKSRLLRDSS